MKRKCMQTLAWIVILLMAAAGSQAENNYISMTEICLKEGSVAALDGDLYGIAGNMLYRLLPAENQAYPVQVVPQPDLFLTALGDQLVGISLSDATAYTWERKAGWQKDVHLEGINLVDLQMLDFAVSDASLYLLVFDFSVNLPRLLVICRGSGTLTADLLAQEIKEIASYVPGAGGVAYLCHASEGHCEYGLLTEAGKLQEMGQTPHSSFSGLASQEREVWFRDSNQVYRVDAQGQVTPASSFATWQQESLYAVVANGEYFLLNQGQLVRANTEPSVQVIEKVVLSGVADPATHQKAQKAAGLQCEVRETYFFWQEQLAQVLIQQDNTVDIYFIDGAFLDATQIFAKRYAYPLSTEGLRASVARMHLPVRDLVEQKGELLALPVYAKPSRYNLVVDLETLARAKELGYALPETYEDYLVQAAAWPDELADAGVLLQGMDARYMVEQTLYQLLLQADDFAEIELEQLTRLLTLTRDAIQRMEACKRIAGPSPAFVLSSQTPLYFAQSESNCQYLPLPLYHGTEGRLGIHVSFLFINPYSQHPEEALAYLEAYQANLSPESENELYVDASNLLERLYYAENRESCLERISTCQAQITATQEKAVQRDLEIQLTELQTELKKIDATRYIVDLESLHTWQILMSQAKVVSWGVIQEKEVVTQIEQFLDGSLSPELFARQFLRMLQMREMEDQ